MILKRYPRFELIVGALRKIGIGE